MKSHPRRRLAFLGASPPFVEPASDGRYLAVLPLGAILEPLPDLAIPVREGDVRDMGESHPSSLVYRSAGPRPLALEAVREVMLEVSTDELHLLGSAALARFEEEEAGALRARLEEISARALRPVPGDR